MNYNVAHKHEDIQLFYSGIKSGLHPQTHPIIHDALDSIKECLDTVGIKGPDGTEYRWNYGLMSGWRHTMLINTSFNAMIARVAHFMLKKYENISCYDTLAVGDDSTECYSSPFGGPWVQGLLDAVGRVGKPEKQIFHAHKGGFIEFLRILYTDKGTYASSVRSACSFVCPDTQSPVPLGGPEMAVAIVDCINRTECRTGTTFLRRSDILCLIKYWINSPDNVATGTFVPPLSAFVSTDRGGLGCIHPHFQPSEITGSGHIEARFRGDHFDQKKLDRTIKGKMAKIAVNLDLTDYAHEYAQDTLLSALQKVKTMVWSKHKNTKTDDDIFSFNNDEQLSCKLTPIDNVSGKTKNAEKIAFCNTSKKEMEPILAERKTFSITGPKIRSDLINHLVNDTCLCITKGRDVPIDFDDTLKEIAITTYFAGSHLVANRYISDHPINEIDQKSSTFKEAHKGLVLLYAKHTGLPSLWLPQRFPSFYSPLIAKHATIHHLTSDEQYVLAVGIGIALKQRQYRVS
jgi:hypothetical protein